AAVRKCAAATLSVRRGRPGPVLDFTRSIIMAAPSRSRKKLSPDRLRPGGRRIPLLSAAPRHTPYSATPRFPPVVGPEAAFIFSPPEPPMPRTPPPKSTSRRGAALAVLLALLLLAPAAPLRAAESPFLDTWKMTILFPGSDLSLFLVKIT